MYAVKCYKMITKGGDLFQRGVGDGWGKVNNDTSECITQNHVNSLTEGMGVHICYNRGIGAGQKQVPNKI